MRQRPCPRGPGPKSSLPGHFRRYHEVVLHTEHARNSAGLRICHLPIQAVRDNSMEFDLAVLHHDANWRFRVQCVPPQCRVPINRSCQVSYLHVMLGLPFANSRHAACCSVRCVASLELSSCEVGWDMVCGVVSKFC